ncbi:MAG: tetratricopeptide repeat protein [Candidatus Limnocylindria bacterium]
MSSLEFLAGKLGKPSSFLMEDEDQERRRVEREITIARANQLIAEGSAAKAIADLSAIDLDGLGTSERLTIKRTLGRAYLESGEGTRAANVLADVVRGYEALGSLEQLARVRAELGRALLMVMSYDEAEAHLSQALRATASGVIKDPIFRVHLLYNLGSAAYYRGEYRSALQHYERAISEGADIADQRWLASIYAGMGMSLREVGDYEAAITSLKRSETLFDSIHNRLRVAEIRFQLARTLWALGNRAKAVAVGHEALGSAAEADHPVLAMRIEGFIGLCEASTGALDAAVARLENLIAKADQLGEPRSRFSARFALAKALGESDPARSEGILRETEALLGGSAAGDDLADVYEELSRVLTLQGRTDEALGYAQRAYKTVRRSQKGGL